MLAMLFLLLLSCLLPLFLLYFNLGSLPASQLGGKRCNWFSASLKRLVPVRITKVDHAKPGAEKFQI